MFTLVRSTCLFFFLGHAYSSSHAISQIKNAATILQPRDPVITLAGNTANTLIIFGFDPEHPTFCRILTYYGFVTANINTSD